MLCVIGLLNCSNWGTREQFFSREIIQKQVHVSAVLKPALQPIKKNAKHGVGLRHNLSTVILPALKLLVWGPGWP